MEEANRILLEKFLAGTCSRDEIALVKTLLNQPENQAVLDAMMETQSMAEWDQVSVENQHMQERTSRLMADMQQRIANTPQATLMPELIPSQPALRMKLLWYAAACASILIITATVFQLTHSNKQSNTIAYIEKINTQGRPVRCLLPDSSIVYLGAGSKLKYPQQFSSSERTIQLQGEAFFEVTPHAQQPFMVYAGSTRTQVLGTSFKVYAFAGEKVEVAVATGKVAVNTASQQIALLTAGSQLSWDSAGGKAIRSITDIAGLTQWTSGELSFNEQPLGSVAAILERRYPVALQFADNRMKNYRVSGTFPPEETITSILDMLGFVGKFNYKTSHSGSKTQFTLYKSK